MGAALEQIVRIVNTLEPESDWEMGLQRILENEIRRRLNRYELADRQLQQKYEMDFKAFRQADVVAEKGYSFEVESDFCDWELAQSGIRSLKQELAEVTT